MEIQQAAALIKKGIVYTSTPQSWADLGCGSGVFTAALAGVLPSNSNIAAIDKTLQVLDAAMGNRVAVHFQQADFVNDDLALSELDGLLMANAIHFVKDKELLIKKLENYLKVPKFLIVEYDHSRPNQWEPYPFPFTELKNLFNRLGYRYIEKIGEQTSIYSGIMYACLIEKLRMGN